jgi:hypothetical protein
VKDDALHLVAEFAERRGRRGAGEAGADDDDLVLPLVGRVDELDVAEMLGPFLLQRTARDLRFEFHGRRKTDFY